MIDREKTDPRLGHEIEVHLKSLGINTPTVETNTSDDYKIAQIEGNFHNVMKTLGLDLNDDSLIDTPRRWAKMMVKDLMPGLNPNLFPKCTTIENKMYYDQVVCDTNIRVMSQCEHHIQTIDGFATIAYIPNNRVLGLSKMNRIVEYFSRRPQVQERLTSQIAESMKYILKTDDVAVMITAKHYCVAARGIEDANSKTTTSHLSGAFRKEPECRAEFMAIARGN